VPVALAQYLKEHPQIRRIALCLDNDEAGREAAQGIIAALPELEVTYRPPANGKDYNDMLREAKGVKNNIRMRGENVR
jgi:DNA primase